MPPAKIILSALRRSPRCFGARRPAPNPKREPGQAPAPSRRANGGQPRPRSRWLPRPAVSRQDDEPRGQAIVEFALVVTFLFLILFAIVDFSRLFFAYATMANGVREGARFGSAQPDDDAAILEHARDMMVLIGDEATVTVTFPDHDASGNSRCSHHCRIVVRAVSDFDVWTPIIPHVEILAQSTMHVE